MVSKLPNRITSPPWRQLIQWIADPIAFQARYGRQYGNLFTMRLAGLGSFVVIGDPKIIQEIFSQSSKFDVGRGNLLAKPLIGQNSLILMDGDHHQRERKLLMPPFHGEKLQTYAQRICLITEQITSQWQANQPFVARAAMQKISLEVIVQVVFGLSEGERYQQLKTELTDWLNMIDSPLRSSVLFFKFLQHDWGAWSPWGKMNRRKQCIHDLLQAEIDERKAQRNKKDANILNLLMAARDENGQAMTDEELRDELVTMLFAGHETTATILAWAFYQILQRLDVCDKLLHEIASLGAMSTPMDIAQLPYLTAVCQETLRMYPVIPVIFPRIVKSPMTIADYWFDAGTILMPSNYLVHYREDIYPNARQFKPERFLDRQYSPSEYFPFGGGNRRCLGYALALLEMKLVLATILSQYQLALADDKSVKMQRRGLTITPSGGVRMVMTEKLRKSSTTEPSYKKQPV
ncbi:MAG: cytochrome P450 [Leptolyngbyaceae cyanobacterium MO_188.B28]|nr:cytochrome P450 [Leptolyngbyaceae cyanobacterium MO_188.B28]